MTEQPQPLPVTEQPPFVPVILEDKCQMAVRMMARRMYTAYCENAGNKNFQGNECPAWDQLPTEIRSHWCAATIAAMPNLNNP